MKKRIRIYAQLPLWKPCIHAFNGTDEAYNQIQMAIAVINGLVHRMILDVTIKDK